MLEQKKISLGIQCFTGSTERAEVLGATGFDFVIFDAEHGANNVWGTRNLNNRTRNCWPALFT